VALKKESSYVYRVIYKTEDIPWHEVNAGRNCHHPIDQLALVIALNILLNCASIGWEFVNVAHKALMANDVDVPLVKVLQHPRVRIPPPIGIATDVQVHDLDPCQPSR
jgi:hypothetical protein